MRLTWMASMVFLVLTGWAAEPGGSIKTGPPPLKVDKAAPLLLEGPTAPPADAPQKPAIPRIMCHDCHGNFLEEPLAVNHAKKEITCVECHGPSEAHKNDESNSTPPDVMFPRDRIAAKCGECHKAHDAPASAVILRWQQRGLQKLNPRELVCTDCHGAHRLKVRTIQWDKKTGKVIPRK